MWGTGTQPQHSGQQYTHTAGYNQTHQGTPIQQYGSQQTGCTASYQQSSTGRIKSIPLHHL